MLRYWTVSLAPLLLITSTIRADDAADQQKREKQFAESMTGVRFKGHFTIDGKEAPPKDDTYTINKVTKTGIDDLWSFTFHIKYGDVDRKVPPLALPVKWAGDTPVIVLDKTTIPGMGTFSAKVVIDGDKYAGTWVHHGAGGGHMWGVIEKIDQK